MKGIEHFRKAEQLLGLVEEREDGFSDTYLKVALVHATLAAATSMSNLVTVWGDIAGMMRADAELADDKPVPYMPAEPLVPCNIAPADFGPERCTLPAGHESPLHEDARKGVQWTRRDLEAAVMPAPGMAPPFSIYESTATDLHMEMPR